MARRVAGRAETAEANADAPHVFQAARAGMKPSSGKRSIAVMSVQ
jgi:hypothetical protein